MHTAALRNTGVARCRRQQRGDRRGNIGRRGVVQAGELRQARRKAGGATKAGAAAHGGASYTDRTERVVVRTTVPK